MLGTCKKAARYRHMLAVLRRNQSHLGPPCRNCQTTTVTLFCFDRDAQRERVSRVHVLTPTVGLDVSSNTRRTSHPPQNGLLSLELCNLAVTLLTAVGSGLLEHRGLGRHQGLPRQVRHRPSQRVLRPHIFVPGKSCWASVGSSYSVHLCHVLKYLVFEMLGT